MAISKRTVREISVVALTFLAAAGSAQANPGGGQGGGDDGFGWGRGPAGGHHPALPAPAALIFGGLAVSAAIAAAKRRKGGKPADRGEVGRDGKDR